MDKFKTDLGKKRFERHFDLQTRSMRENLDFTGIPVPVEGEFKDTEEVIKNFMTNQMQMESPIEFHRAHRFGKEYDVKDPQNGRTLYATRSIVCRLI